MTGKPKLALFYAATIAAAAGAFLVIRHLGSGLVAPEGAGAFTQHGIKQPADLVLTHVLASLVVVILCARGLGALFRRFRQPPVVGEMIAGIMLGPSLLGRLVPGASAVLLPNSVAPYLSVVANVGVILYMFLVGVELDTDRLRGRTHASVAISHASIIAPFLLGSALSLWLYPLFSSSDVPFVVFALFIGVSMSVTAFPVLARILTDRGMHTSELGAIAIACASVDDVTAWCLFALVVSVARARPADAWTTLALTGGFILSVFALVRPLARRLARLHDQGKITGQGAIVVVCVALLASALATQAIGIHALFGAFLAGAVIPHDCLLAQEIKRKFEDLVVVLFLPAFFAFTGLRTQIGLVHGPREWLICLLIVAVASAGKFLGSAAAARVTGLDWRRSAALGILMNTRGLMELIVLNVGLDLGVISPALFAMLVIMAVVTTLATTPVLQALAEAPEPASPAGMVSAAARETRA